MTLTDSFLQLMDSQNANSIVLQVGRPPTLRVGSAEKSLSMPPLDNSTLEQIVEDLDLAGDEVDLDAGPARTSYRTTKGTIVAARVHKGPDGLHVTLGAEPVRRPGAPAAVAPPPPGPLPPAPVAAPAPVQIAVAASTPVAPSPASSLPPRPDCELTELRAWIARQTARGATDVILSAGLAPRSRVGTALEPGELEPTIDDEVLALIYDSLTPDLYQGFVESGSADVGLELDGERYRGGLFRQHRGLGLALRPVRTQIPTLQSLGLPRSFEELVKHRTGLVLMTGATGSGKSSTLAALIGHLNATSKRHVITLEDPIEFVHPSHGCLVHQRQLGRDVDSFASGLRAALRENPDVILVGEVRDFETAVAALAAAETGHLVLATLHSRTSDTAIERLIDLFPAHRQGQARIQLASVLRSVVSQLLLPGRTPGELVPAYERLENNTAVAAKIRDGRWHQLRSEIMKGKSDGMIAMESCLAELVRRGRLAAQTALDACNTAEMRSQLGR